MADFILNTDKKEEKKFAVVGAKLVLVKEWRAETGVSFLAEGWI